MKKRKSKLGKERKVLNQREFGSSSVDRDYEGSEKVKLIIAGIFICGVIGLSFYYLSIKENIDNIKRETSELRRKEKLAKEKQESLDRLLLSIKTNEEAGDMVFKEGNYFRSVFEYKQVLGYDDKNINIYKKLKRALEKSCESGTKEHCNLTSSINEKITMLENNGTEETVDERIDSILIHIGRQKMNQ